MNEREMLLHQLERAVHPKLVSKAGPLGWGSRPHGMGRDSTAVETWGLLEG